MSNSGWHQVRTVVREQTEQQNANPALFDCPITPAMSRHLERVNDEPYRSDEQEDESEPQLEHRVRVIHRAEREPTVAQLGAIGKAEHTQLNAIGPVCNVFEVQQRDVIAPLAAQRTRHLTRVRARTRTHLLPRTAITLLRVHSLFVCDRRVHICGSKRRVK